MNFIPKYVEYRNLIDSKQYNDERKDIFSDISSLKDSSSNIQAQISTLTDLKEASDFTLLSKIQGLESILADLNFGFTIITLYNADTVMYPESINVNARARHEQLYGRAILNTVESRRLYIAKDIRTGNDVVSSNLDDLVFYYTNSDRTGSNINRIVETSINPVFDPSSNDVFLRRYESFDPISDVDLVVQLNTKNGLDIEFNNLYLSPLPENTATLDYVRYSGGASTNENFYNTSLQRFVDYAIPNLRRLAFAFDPVKMNRLDFRLKQTNRMGESPYKFLLGLRDVALVNHVYTNISYVGFKVRTDETRQKMVNLTTNLESFPDNCQVFVYNTLADFNDVTTNYIFRTGDEIDAVNFVDVSDSDEIYVLVKLLPFAGKNDTPELTTIFIEWR